MASRSASTQSVTDSAAMGWPIEGELDLGICDIAVPATTGSVDLRSASGSLSGRIADTCPPGWPQLRNRRRTNRPRDQPARAGRALHHGAGVYRLRRISIYPP